ncbi:FMN-linked oxidoreductase, partial [Lactarius akahatsu]
PACVGATNLQHRIVMAFLTRLRADRGHIHGELSKKYYAQRSSVPGTFIISLAPCPLRSGTCEPGIWSDAQVARKRFIFPHITNAVHASGSYVFLQLWVGCTADPAVLRGSLISPISLGNGKLHSGDGEPIVPRELAVVEIEEHVQLFSKAANNAIEAGFDGMEVHVVNGHLHDQFLQTVSNERMDECEGSIDNCVHFPLEVNNAVVETAGAERMAVRISPLFKFQNTHFVDPLPSFATFIGRVRDAHPNFAYTHVVESRANDITIG